MITLNLPFRGLTGMAIRSVILANDPRLRQTAKKVNLFTSDLKQLAEDMLETMGAQHGVGLAGPQIGVMQRIFVAEIPPSRGNGTEPHPQSGVTYVLINPEIVTCAENRVEGKEGCLSIPTWYGLVERPEWVEVRAQDLDGQKIRLKVDDLLARIFMHEIDHLNGVLFIDQIKDPEKLWQILPEEAPAEEEKEKKSA
jgi:peptide deformylase